MGKRLLIIGLLSSFASASGQAPAPNGDPIAGKLEEAKKAYKAEIEKLSSTNIINEFEKADEQAREAADVDLVKTIKAERAKFEETGKLPRRFASTEYAKQRAAIRKVMSEAYTIAIRDYLKARKDDDAEKIAEERDAFKEDRTIVVPIKVEATPKSEFGFAKFDTGSEQVRAVRVRVGDPQFTLLWDTTADIDLHVIEPGGKEIYWNERKGNKGGELDVDNTEGYGPENIAWPEPGSKPAPPGDYKWFVTYYGGNRGIPLKTNWKVRVKHAGKVEIVEGIPDVPGTQSKTYTLQIEPPPAAR